MTKEDKELLFKDLCARLPDGIILKVGYTDIKLDRKHQGIGILYPEDCSDEFDKRHNEDFYIVISGCYYGNDIKPYLRPMSSMTEEEYKEFKACHCVYDSHLNFQPMMCTIMNERNMFDWLDKNMFDYRGLIPKGLAIEVTKENNPYI